MSLTPDRGDLMRGLSRLGEAQLLFAVRARRILFAVVTAKFICSEKAVEQKFFGFALFSLVQVHTPSDNYAV